MKNSFKVYPDSKSDILWILFKSGAIDYYNEPIPGVNIEISERIIAGVEILGFSKLLNINHPWKNSKVFYDQNDTFHIKLKKGEIDHSKQKDFVLVNFSDKNQPLSIEILEATKIFQNLKDKERKNQVKVISNQGPTLIAHRIK